MRRAIAEALLNTRAQGQPAILATQLSTGAQCLILPGSEVGELRLDEEALAEARALIAADRSRMLNTAAGPTFLHTFIPPYRLVIVGAVHVAEPLARMAMSAGYAVTVVDPRRAYTVRDRFTDVDLIADWPDEALAKLNLDERTAVVTLTHDPKLDDPALLVALPSPAFYIGCLGSKKTHTARINRLRNAGLTEEQIGRMHGPVGLAIGALTPAEIAVAILAEITQVRRGPNGS